MGTCDISKKIRNTGSASCKIQWDIIDKGLFIPNKTDVIPNDNPEDIKDWIDQKIQAAKKEERLYPMALLNGFEDTSEDLKTANTGYGDIVILGDGAKSANGQYEQDVNYTKKLRSFNKVEGRIIFVLRDGSIALTRNSAGRLQGFLCQPYFSQGKLPNGTDLNTSIMNISFKSPQELEDRVEIIPLDISATDLDGLFDIRLENIAPPSGGMPVSAEIKLFNDLTGADVTALYQQSLAVPSAWIVKDLNGNTTSVTPTYNSNLESFTSTSLQQGYTISLADPFVLSTLQPIPVLGIEGMNTITVQ